MADIQFPFRELSNFPELFDDICGTIRALARTKIKPGPEGLSFYKRIIVWLT